MGVYTVGVAGQTVNLLSSDSGGATPSIPTNMQDEIRLLNSRRSAKPISIGLNPTSCSKHGVVI